LHLFERLPGFDLIFEHAAILRQLGAIDLVVILPEARPDQRFPAMQECLTNGNHDDSLRTLPAA